MKKSAAALLLILVFCFLFLSPFSSAEEEEPLADIVTDEAPSCGDEGGCRITCAEELFALAASVNGGAPDAAAGCFFLCCDIVIDGAWQPIGTESFPFRGSFDGGGHRILLRAGSSEKYFGLFGVTEGAELSRLALENADISALNGCEALGGIVALMRGGHLCRSYVSGELCSESADATGGLVGVLDGGRIEDCFSAADLTVQNGGGGIAGRAENGACLSRSYGIGFVRGLCGADFDALLALSDGTVTVESCYNIDGSGMYFGSHLTREEGTRRDSFPGFDFEKVWQQGSGVNYPYPVLRVSPFLPEESFAPDAPFPVSGVTDIPHSPTPSSVLAHGENIPLDGVPSFYLTPNLPPIRDQRSYNICWAFADCAAAEISLIRKGLASPGSIDLAELQLVRLHHDGPLKSDGSYNDPLNHFGGDRRVCGILEGDNDILSSKTLASWMGLMQEDARTGFNDANITSVRNKALPYDYAFAKDCAHLENEREFPLSDTEDIKNAVIEYGGVTMAYYHHSSYFTKNNTYYYASKDVGTNHAVIIVGWDDTISRALFYDSTTGKRPDRDGAWIIRNSHGANANDNGLIYMSYASSVFTAEGYTSYAWDYSTADNYDFCYQYDGGVGIDHVLLNTPTIYEANVFPVGGIERLEAVSFWMDDRSDVSYTVRVYTDLRSASNPSSGTLSAIVPGTTTYPGYYTVPLPTAVELAPGSSFSVVIQFSGQSSYSLPLDRTWIIDWFSSYACSEAGQSFYSPDNLHWIDVGASNGGNLRIKAFTSKDQPDIAKSRIELSQSIFTYDGNEKRPGLTVTYNGTALRENTDYTLSYSDNVNAGTARVLVTGIGSYCGTAEKTFTILKARQLINARIRPNRILVGGTAQISVTEAKGALSYSSSDDSVVSVNASGLVTGLQLGSAVINIRAGETENYSAAAASVSISVLERILGDVDGSGRVEDEDLARLMKNLAGAEVPIDSSNADLNGDGKINTLDFMLLYRQLLQEK